MATTLLDFVITVQISYFIFVVNYVYKLLNPYVDLFVKGGEMLFTNLKSNLFMPTWLDVKKPFVTGILTVPENLQPIHDHDGCLISFYQAYDK